MRQRVGVLKRVLANGPLRRVELAFLCFGAAEYGVWVAVLVYAYRHGGTTMAAVIAVVQLVPAAVIAPTAARLAEGRGSAAALRIGYVAQAGAIGSSAACMLLAAPPVAVYAGAVVAASAVTLTRPAQSALLPQLVETPAQLTAANVTTGWVESLSLLLGPALAGVLIGLDGPGAALALFAAAVAYAALLVAPVVAPVEGDDSIEPAVEHADQALSILGLLRSRAVVALLVIGAVQFIVIGALDVLEVVLALNVLGLGAAAAGYLAAAYGAGGIVGGFAAVGLVGRHRLRIPLLAAALVWGTALVVLGVWPAVGAAFVLLAVGGATRTVLDSSGRTLLHRAVPAEAHRQAFALLEGLAMLGLACGSALVPLIDNISGVQATLICMGALLIVVPLAVAGRLRTFERAAPALDRELALLRTSPLFTMLPAPVLDDLARALRRYDVAPGDTLIQEGATGRHFYLLVSGELEVSIRGRFVRRVQPGDGVGEVALLRDGIRTATVSAVQQSTLYALARGPFLEALTGSRPATEVAEAMVAERTRA